MGFTQEFFEVFSEKISSVLKKIPKYEYEKLEEIRLRANKPLIIMKNNTDSYIDSQGFFTLDISKAFIVEKNEIDKTIQRMSNYSLYSVDEDIKHGFLTLKGGHRVGLVGRAVVEENKIRTIKNISALNIRIAREVKGCSLELIKNIYKDGVKHTLIVSSPGCGKTTLLRDIIRVLSDGNKELKLKGHKVGLVDERGEIAACYHGIPQLDVGVRTDVLDSCPKIIGIYMLLRSMSPEVIAVDEIGSLEDAKVIEDALKAGVKIIATAHGSDFNEVKNRIGIRDMLEKKAFEVVVVLSRKNGPGTIDEIIKLT